MYRELSEVLIRGRRACYAQPADPGRSGAQVVHTRHHAACNVKKCLSGAYT